MANDSYFQEDLTDQLIETEDNAWLKDLPPSAQVRYLKAVANLNEGDLSDDAKMKIL